MVLCGLQRCSWSHRPVSTGRIRKLTEGRFRCMQNREFDRFSDRSCYRRDLVSPWANLKLAAREDIRRSQAITSTLLPLIERHGHSIAARHLLGAATRTVQLLPRKRVLRQADKIVRPGFEIFSITLPFPTSDAIVGALYSYRTCGRKVLRNVLCVNCT